MSPFTEATWHPGEEAIHSLLHTPQRHNPTTRGLPPSYGHRISISPLLAVGTLDRLTGRPWVTLWGGEPGFARPIAEGGILGIRARVGLRGDPVVEALLGSGEGGTIAEDGEVVRHDGEGKVVAGLSIDLQTRDRVKIAGRAIAGSVTRIPESDGAAGEVQMAVQVRESLGNCPKYINKRRIVPHHHHAPHPRVVFETGTGRRGGGRGEERAVDVYGPETRGGGPRAQDGQG
ncbi:hypothetical protein F4778DRAFT_537998 [Xylariomycetidae sp. FL2044]|nr:hypothetical protein F4778DRAFT_537998 [Xylariomycetidae sp. FL2044]